VGLAAASPAWAHRCAGLSSLLLGQRVSTSGTFWMKGCRERWSSGSLTPGIQYKLQATELKNDELKPAPILALDHQVQMARSSPSSWLCRSGSHRISLSGLQCEFKKSQNHRMVWVGKDLIDNLVPIPTPRPPPQAGTPSTRPICSRPRPAWP